ncbi:MAG: pyrroline-5-carboxylate reductase [Phycisphaerales bacterium]|nr:pyrroline-5-carboxylate reductase [Phycisphaerales bacterium]
MHRTPSGGMLHGMQMRLGVFGAGNMGWSIVSGAIDAGLLTPEEVAVVDHDETRIERARARGIRVCSPTEAVAATHLLVAVKPQDFNALAESMGPLPDRRVVISVMAGLRSESIRAALGPNAAVVRVMPNTPARLQAGVSAICRGDGAEESDLDFPRLLMESVGVVVEVDESRMFAVTATSGSGPAFVLRMAEAMEAAAIEEGIDHETARILVQETILGAATLMRKTGEEPADLRKAVTSKGGTTAAGLDAMTEHGFDAAVAAAIRAATERGRTLDQEHG